MINERPDLLERDITIYGYPLKDLFLFAYACRKHGIDENDLRDYVLNLEFAIQMIREEQEEAFQRYFARRANDGHIY